MLKSGNQEFQDYTITRRYLKWSKDGDRHKNKLKNLKQIFKK